ncbi:MAG TPA: galactan 5-O-arabinofuranosyltransferase [Candidatus Corynebacterium gallistercoris]|uniref:Galactan 5-O-arabinofuranosyltransferase n=1 Tax=Candidatus Corynebacterium gallistercoris TaxID=2838530 RepID=A0A9D1RX05_9CORY|nr:galactan 5-O-arabinofuranosyltransferase [Candidatus Corynebacterium gallistercoris]
MLRNMALAGGAATVATLACWMVLNRINFPAFSHSNVLRGLATAGTTLVIVAAAVACYYWVHPRGRGKAAAFLMSAIIHLAPAALVVTSVGLPLGGTRLYLDGVSVDQAFRTQFLTRMADTPGWHDMAYVGEPSFYPGLWFFTGGIFAKITGLAGWAAYQPWALITLAVTGSMLVPVWQRLTNSVAVASAVSLTTVAVTMFYAPEEPYAAIVAMGLPAALILGYRAVRGSHLAVLGMVIYLGLSANLYTLYTGLSALSVVVLAVMAAFAARSIAPLVRLAVMGVGSMLIALVGWGPYVLAILTEPHGPTGTAQHYLPESGTEIPVPFFHAVSIGILSFIALVWLVLRYRKQDVAGLGVGLVVCYCWVVASMMITVLGTTLLGFRVELPIALILTTAGVLAIADWRLVQGPKLQTLESLQVLGAGPAAAKAITRAMAVILAVSCVHYATSIPSIKEDKIDLAYTDADGDAIRGDRQPADSTAYYAAVDEVLMDHFGQRSGTVVLTDEQHFMSFYPYHSYQAMTAHYANPLGEFARRNAAIEEWTTFSEPEELTEAMDAAETSDGWARPDALILRGQLDVEPVKDDSASLLPENGELPKVTGTGDDEFTFTLADDIYPNSPNVQFRTVAFPAELFSEGWELHQVGPYVVAIRV